jgi:tRNA (mo5U34)-methyltransferase
VVGDATIPLSSPADIDWCRRFEQLLSLRLPDLTGKTVLDVSALDGYFSFAAERFGASRVAAVDLHAWRQSGARERFEHTRDTLGSRVEDLDVQADDVSRDTVGQFDVVLFLGALRHANNPLRALERMVSVTKELLVVETLVDIALPGSSVTRVDWWGLRAGATNWSKLPPAALVRMLYGAGFGLVVSYQPKRLSVGSLLGLPASARTSANRVSSTPWRSRERLVRDCAKSLLTQRHLVTHSSW